MTATIGDDDFTTRAQGLNGSLAIEGMVPSAGNDKYFCHEHIATFDTTLHLRAIWAVSWIVYLARGPHPKNGPSFKSI
jgi:hypothetical protein